MSLYSHEFWDGRIINSNLENKFYSAVRDLCVARSPIRLGTPVLTLREGKSKRVYLEKVGRVSTGVETLSLVS